MTNFLEETDKKTPQPCVAAALDRVKRQPYNLTGQNMGRGRFSPHLFMGRGHFFVHILTCE